MSCLLPRHLLAAVEVLESSLQDSPELLDCILFPSGLEPEEDSQAQGEANPK